MLPGPAEWPAAWPLDGLDGGADLLAQRAEATPDALAALDADEGDRLTYAALDGRVSACADWLSAACAPGDRVGLLLDAGVAFAEAYFATARYAAPAVPLNVRLDADALAAQADRADVAALVAQESTAALAREVAPDGASLLLVGDRPTPSSPSAPTSGRVTVSDRERGRVGERLIMFTSGTTGRPKGVRLTRENLVASAVGSAERLGVEPGDRWLAPLPMYHTGGLAPVVRSTLYGTSVVVQRTFDPSATAAVVEAHDVTGLSLIPTMLKRLLDDGWRPPDSLRFVLLGGAPAGRELLDRALDRGVPTCPTYGLTEAASQVSTATPSETREFPGTVGRPLSTVDLAVLDGDERCAPGDTGEVVVAGPAVTPGYLDGDDAITERGLRTGDLGRRDADGRLWIVGRRDDLIVTGGEKVAPKRVGRALRATAGVEDAAVVGLPDEEWGERVAALVVASDDLTGAAIRDAVRGSLADFEVPKTVRRVDEIPRTVSGTVDRAAVRERLRDARE